MKTETCETRKHTHTHTLGHIGGNALPARTLVVELQDHLWFSKLSLIGSWVSGFITRQVLQEPVPKKDTVFVDGFSTTAITWASWIPALQSAMEPLSHRFLLPLDEEEGDQKHMRGGGTPRLPSGSMVDLGTSGCRPVRGGWMKCVRRAGQAGNVFIASMTVFDATQPLPRFITVVV